MPTVKGIAGPYRVFFYSFDCHERPHVHVQQCRNVCKFWLHRVALAQNYGLTSRQLNEIRAITTREERTAQDSGGMA